MNNPKYILQRSQSLKGDKYTLLGFQDAGKAANKNRAAEHIRYI
jgi:hypothetical protein